MQRAGFTLVESIIYIGIVGLLAVGLIYYSASTSSLGTKLSVASEVHANARALVDVIVRTTRSADEIGPLTVYNSDSGSLQLLMEDSLENPTTVYRTPGGSVEITRGAGLPSRLTSQKVSVSKLRLTPIGPTIRVEIEMEYRDAGSKEYEYRYSLSTTVMPRK